MHTTPTIRAGGATPPTAAMPTPRLRSKDRVWTAEQFMAEALRDPRQVAKLAKGGLRLEASAAAMDALRASDFGRYIGDDGAIEPPEAQASVEVAFGILVVVLATAAIAYIGGYHHGYVDGVKSTESDEGGTDGGGGEEGEEDGGGGDDTGETGDTGGRRG